MRVKSWLKSQKKFKNFARIKDKKKFTVYWLYIFQYIHVYHVHIPVCNTTTCICINKFHGIKYLPNLICYTQSRGDVNITVLVYISD